MNFIEGKKVWWILCNKELVKPQNDCKICLKLKCNSENYTKPTTLYIQFLVKMLYKIVSFESLK